MDLEQEEHLHPHNQPLQQSHQQQQQLGTKITRIPKPFSIESLISSPAVSVTTPQTVNHMGSSQSPADTNKHDCGFEFPTALGTNIGFGLPGNFPIYNPWMGYLSHFLDPNPPDPVSMPGHQRDKISEMFLSQVSDPRYLFDPTAAAALHQRDKLAQYLAGGGLLRDPHSADGSIPGYTTDKERFAFHNSAAMLGQHQQHTIGNLSGNLNENAGAKLSQLFVRTERPTDLSMDELSVDGDDGDSGSELCLTFSPDGDSTSGKNRGKIFYLQNNLGTMLPEIYFNKIQILSF